MKIIRLQAENIKKLKAVEIVPEGNVVKITGKNEQGKTSVLDAIWWALAGTKNIQDQPIRKGESRANVTLDLGDLIVTRTFTPSGSYLKVENKDGAAFKSPQAMLDKLIGELTFDPLAFAKSDSKKQVEMLLKVVNIQPDIERLKAIANTDFDVSKNPLQTLNNAYKAVYNNRTLVNRQLETAKKMLDGIPEVEPTEPVSTAELVAEKERLEEENRRNELKRSAARAAEQKISDLVKKKEEILEKINQLYEELKQTEADIDREEHRLELINREVAELKDHDLTEIKNRIANADEINRKAQLYQERQKAARNVELLKAESEELTRRLEDILKYKQELIAGANFPIAGLDFGNGGILYQGLPFEQASSAQKLQVSLAIAMALNPKLRVIRIEDGSLLDSDHMKIIEEMAREKDYQVWIECVDETGKVGIYIEDGEVKGVS
jgi:DNA repair exonuclease SbcCD ATPase subunit